ncbi:MAG: phosphopentomutase [bacterium]
MVYRRIILVVLDGCGVGELPDASDYNDTDTATLPHVAQATGGLCLPHLGRMGLGNLADIAGVPKLQSGGGRLSDYGCGWGKMAEQSPGKDSTTGHWEIAGVILPEPFPVFPDGFPKSLVREFERRAGVRVVGNRAASGTDIILELGTDHVRTGRIILYTSADSVWQMAAHEDVCPPQRLYELCRIARELLTGEQAVARVIARPFTGLVGSFVRTAGRRDFSLEPPRDTVLDQLVRLGIRTAAIGKVWDLYAGRGLTSRIKASGNDRIMQALDDFVRTDREHSVAVTNLSDFDMLWGHRRDPDGFAAGLERFDRQLGELLPHFRDDDLLLITADHGCDPTCQRHTDHTREYVPLLVCGRRVRPGVNLGVRETFADVAATLAEIFEIGKLFPGRSFLSEILPGPPAEK